MFGNFSYKIFSYENPPHLFNLLDSFIASAVVEQTVERRKPKLTPAKPEYHDKCDFLHFETIDEQAQDF